LLEDSNDPPDAIFMTRPNREGRLDMCIHFDQFAVALAAVTLAVPVVAQVRPAAKVEHATFTRNEPAAHTEKVRFGRQLPRVGDQVEQTIMLEMYLAISVCRDKQLLESNEVKMRNTQQRAVTTTEIVDGRVQAVLVRYPKATKQHAVGEAGRQSFDTATAPAAVVAAQPVQGKAYRCRRELGEEGRLVVTDEEGNIPPLEEYEIVAQSMDAVGRSNPLADYLAGRSVAVGEILALPREVADRLFGIKEQFGDITRFDLTLREVEIDNNTQCATFHASIDATSNDSSHTRLQLEGPLVIEVASCRAVQMKFFGPIAMTESRGTYSTAYQIISAGQLKMAINATYRDTPR
jgi:hypothetical protein